ncbi:MAG TPA: trehalose-6-phosphate synthase, partial [Anaeromyxobacteraceae bacterium]|nr:trehalose-6-phosphate synthase [Anaeromyxobacteraceae bacterium]
MRAALRFVVPLLLLLGAVAVGASAFMERQAHRWAERDLAIRALAILHVVRAPRAGLLAAGERPEVARLLDGLVRDERIVAAAACAQPGALEVETDGFPAELGCDRTDPPTREGVHQLPSGPVLVSVLPVADDRGEPVGRLVLLHDMSYLDRRASVTRWATLLVFCLVALLAAGATILASRLSWTSWTRELRRHLWAPLQGRPDAPAPDRRGFAPVLSDVRELVQRLASEEAGGMGGRWTPERLRRVLRSRLHGEGVVVVANREPYVHERDASGAPRLVHPASGLVTALEPVMRACSGTWIAHGSGSADRDVIDADDRILVPPGEGSYRLRRLWLSEEEERGYYYGFANEGLWPLCHIAHARPEFRSADFEMYRRVNLRFARAVLRESTGTDPIVLVQDYHFALLPRMLRELLPRATIITFWHTPFPHAERFAICPEAGELLEGMLGSSIVGFHTQAHCNNFLGCVDHLLESRIDRERQAVVMAGRETLVRPYPISIEWPGRWATHAAPVAECRAEVRRAHGLPPDCLLGVGVDRLDYTKG